MERITILCQLKSLVSLSFFWGFIVNFCPQASRLGVEDCTMEVCSRKPTYGKLSVVLAVGTWFGIHNFCKQDC